jgi:hypothetical protein
MNSVSSGEWIDVRGKRRGASGSIPRHCPGSGLSVAELRPPLNQAVRLPLIAPITVEQQPGHARPQRATQHGPPNDNLGRQRHGCPFWFPRRKINARQGSRFQVPGSLVPVLEGPRSRFRVPGSSFRRAECCGSPGRLSEPKIVNADCGSGAVLRLNRIPHFSVVRRDFGRVGRG